MKNFLLLILCGIPAVGLAETRTELAGPISGFIFDRQSHAIRPMIGVAGSSFLGQSVVPGVDAAAISPDGAAALITTGGKLCLVTQLQSLTPSVAAIDGALGDADLFAWEGSNAAVYSSASGRAQLIRDLAGTPTADAAISLAGLPGRATALALASSRLLVGVADEAAGGVYLIAPDAAPQLLVSAANPVAISATNQTLYVADRDRQQIWEVRNFTREATPMLFADEASGIQTPAAVRVSTDRQRLFVANAGDNSIEVFDVDTRSATGRIALDFAPTALDLLGQQSLLLLNSGSDGQPFYVLTGSTEPAVYFVPVERQNE